MNQGEFSGKRVIVTGGSRGIGAETVRAFAREGAKVAFLYHNSVDSADAVAKETGATPIRCDLADPYDAERAIQEAETALGGGVDILVNNAGIAVSGLLQDLSQKEWDRLVSVNLTSVFVCSRLLIPNMVRQGFGRIVNISSIWGMVGASCEAAYSAVKAGVIGLTKALAKELGPSGITVNCVAPGVIDTDMMKEYDEETKRALAEETPLGRLGTPADVAASILFLSGKGGSFITGQVLSPNGGFVI
ncbi:MAG: 3-oxoacyl-ACP reductase FabG [Clostridia bacterium]|nr:3-oxoacyl-ACP reductase FabG [Clostridia bacterium]MBR5044182.1 3-oxoacyl-ACP reductase FabG [Clostridia bacterium]